MDLQEERSCSALPTYFFIIAFIPILLLGFYIGRFWNTFVHLHGPTTPVTSYELTEHSPIVLK